MVRLVGSSAEVAPELDVSELGAPELEVTAYPLELPDPEGGERTQVDLEALRKAPAGAEDAGSAEGSTSAWGDAKDFQECRAGTPIASQSIEEQPSSVLQRVSKSLLRMCSECEQATQELPEVAVMLQPEAEASVALPACVEVCADLPSSFFEEQRRLLICRLRRSRAAPALTPAKQLLALEELLREATAGARASEGPWLWPLHSGRVRQALLALEELMLAGGKETMRSVPCWKRVLYWLRIQMPADGGPFFQVVEDVYGPNVAFNFRWAHFYTQQVWLLAALVLICVFAGIEPASTGAQRILWEISKFGMLLWALRVAIQRRLLLKRSVVRNTEDDGRQLEAQLKRQHSRDSENAATCQASKEEGPQQPDRSSTADLPEGDDGKAPREQDPEQPQRPATADSPGGGDCKAPKEQGPQQPHRPATADSPGGGDCKAWTWTSGHAWNPQFQERGPSANIIHWLKMLLFAVPVISLFVLAINMTLLGITQLLVHLTYVWGDCMNLDCRDPAAKHGFGGWLAEVSVDILLAIVFELFFQLSKPLAEWLATMRNYRHRDEHRLSVEMLTVVIFSVERIGTFGIVAFLFVPQWETPPANNRVDMSRDCSDLIIGDASFFCLQRRLPLRQRQDVFARSLTGPFVVAPFVGIGIKVLAPLAADRLDRFARNLRCCWVCDPLCGIFRGVARILALIFAYDGESVGCLSFVAFGWPFRAASTPEGIDRKESRKGTDVEQLYSPGSCSTTEGGVDASSQDCELAQWQGQPEALLQQGAMKPFEPMSELLEMELNFLWVLFFGPILPWGIIPMLFARLCETKSDLTKLLFSRRRCFPEPDGLERSLQRAFLRGAVCGAVGWSVGLSLITYNGDLWRWGWWKLVCSLSVICWLIASAGFTLMHADASWCVVIGGVSALLLTAISMMLIYDEF